jgi:hypothetical protein
VRAVDISKVPGRKDPQLKSSAIFRSSNNSDFNKHQQDSNVITPMSGQHRNFTSEARSTFYNSAESFNRTLPFKKLSKKDKTLIKSIEFEKMLSRRDDDLIKPAST